MKQTNFRVLSAGFALVAAALAGCATAPKSASSEGASGAKLWAQNCSRCHNARSPSDYSNEHWEVAMLHMRVRANLTAEEHKKVLEFLQSGN